MVITWRHALVLGLCILTVRVALAAGGEISVEADRTSVSQNESFKVEYSYTADLDNEPGFEALNQDFDILGQNRSSSLQSVNGRFSYTFKWELTLMPKRAGNLTIPPVMFDGVPSASLSIQVRPASDDASGPIEDLALETELTPSEGYVQGQFIYTLRLYHRGWLQGGNLSEPDFGNSDALVRELDQVKSYTIFRDGERVQVYEQSYLVFPQSSGELSAKAATFTGQLREPGRARRLKRVSAPARTAVVKPVPATFSGGDFLPATSVTLSEVWPAADGQFAQGQPITREIKLTAKGLTAAQLPTLELDPIDGVKAYPDQARREDSLAQDGVTGTLTQAVALVPQRGGDIVVPALTVRWWDTVAGRAREAVLPARTLNVRGAATNSGVPAAALAGPGAQVSPSSDGGFAQATGIWRTTTWLFAALWLLTLLLMFMRRRVAVRPALAAKPVVVGKTSLHKGRAAVKSACDAADPNAAISALLALASLHSPDHPVRSINELRGQVDDELALELDRLRAAAYGKRPTWSEPHRLWRLVAQWRPRAAATKRAASGTDALAPL